MEGEADPALWRMESPPEGVYDTPTQAYEAMNQFARDHGYGFVQKKIIYSKTEERRRYVYTCDRHGKHEYITSIVLEVNADRTSHLVAVDGR